MRRAAKVDDNQEEIVKALRAVGATVQTLAAVGKGVPDLLVGYQGQTILVEVKDGKKSPSERRLTEDQLKWHGAWNGGPLAIVTDVEGAWRAIGLLKGKNENDQS
jgi:Holliday junction resolvase